MDPLGKPIWVPSISALSTFKPNLEKDGKSLEPSWTIVSNTKNQKTKKHMNPEESERLLPFDISDVVFLLKKYLLLITIIPLITAAIGFVWAINAPEMYVAQTTFMVKANFENELHVQQSGASFNAPARDDADSLLSIANAIVSESVILEMIEKMQLRDDPTYILKSNKLIPDFLAGGNDNLTDEKLIAKVLSRYNTHLESTTRLLKLSVTDYDADRALVISKELVNVFMENLGDQRLEQASQIRNALISQAKRVQKEALAAEVRLKNFRLQHPDLLVEQDSDMFNLRILDQSTALNNAKTETSRLESILAALQQIDSVDGVNQVFQVGGSSNDQYLAELLRGKLNAKANFSAIQNSYTSIHPKYKEAAIRLQDAERALYEYANEFKKGVYSEYTAAQQRVANLKTALSELQSSFIQFKSVSAEFRALKDEIDRLWNTHSQLQDRVMNLDLSPESMPSILTELSKPIQPDEMGANYFPVLAGFVVGLLISVGGVFWSCRKGLPFTSTQQPDSLLNVDKIGEFDIHNDSMDALKGIVIATGNRNVIHITTPDNSTLAEEFANTYRTCSDECGIRTLLVRFCRSTSGSNGEKQYTNQSAKPTTNLNTSGNAFAPTVLYLPADILADLPNFEKQVRELLNNYHRIVFDTTNLQGNEPKYVLARLCPMTIIAIDSASKTPRSIYTKFVETMVSRGARKLVSVYLSSSSKNSRVLSIKHRKALVNKDQSFEINY